MAHTADDEDGDAAAFDELLTTLLVLIDERVRNGATRLADVRALLRSAETSLERYVGRVPHEQVSALRLRLLTLRYTLLGAEYTSAQDTSADDDEEQE